MRYIEGHGLVFDGQDTPRADLLAQSRAFLLAAGMHPLDADDALVDRRGLIVRAWIADSDEMVEGPDGVLVVAPHFVQEHHDGAQPVTVVCVHQPLEATV